MLTVVALALPHAVAWVPGLIAFALFVLLGAWVTAFAVAAAVSRSANLAGGSIILATPLIAVSVAITFVLALVGDGIYGGALIYVAIWIVAALALAGVGAARDRLRRQR